MWRKTLSSRSQKKSTSEGRESYIWSSRYAVPKQMEAVFTWQKHWQHKLWTHILYHDDLQTTGSFTMAINDSKHICFCQMCTNEMVAKNFTETQVWLNEWESEDHTSEWETNNFSYSCSKKHLFSLNMRSRPYSSLNCKRSETLVLLPLRVIFTWHP